MKRAWFLVFRPVSSTAMSLSLWLNFSLARCSLPSFRMLMVRHPGNLLVAGQHLPPSGWREEARWPVEISLKPLLTGEVFEAERLWRLLCEIVEHTLAAFAEQLIEVVRPSPSGVGRCRRRFRR